MNNKIVVGLLVALTLLFGAAYFTKGSNLLGKASGVSHFQTESFLQGLAAGARDAFSISNTGAVTNSATTTNTGRTIVSTFTQGGGIRATSTVAAVGTIQDGDFDTENVIDYTVNQADVTLTTAASTSSSYPSSAGQTRTIYVRNASTTASADIIFAAGTGVLFKKATSTLTLIGDTDGANFARITFMRKANTDIEAFIEFFLDL